MRVLHLGKFFPPYRGGMETYLAALTAAMVDKGIATAVLAHAPPGNHHTSQQRVAEVEVTLAACYGQWLYTPVSPSIPWHLTRLIKQFRPDLLHLHMPNPAVFFALLNPTARRLPWVVHWHSDVPLDARHWGLRWAYHLYRPWEQALLRHTQAIIATSAPYRDSSTALKPWRNKVHVIPLGLAEATSEPALETLRWPTQGLKVLAVGRLAYYKGFDILLRALAQVPEAGLVLIGSGECEAQLRKRAAELGIHKRVQFAGSVDEAALTCAYAAADVFCLPSIERSEAFGLVLLEAMRARLPVLASSIPGSGVGYVVEEGITGQLLPVQDESAWANALTTLAADPSLRWRLGAAGQIRWQRLFSLMQVVEETEQLYRTLLTQAQDHATTRPEASSPPE